VPAPCYLGNEGRGSRRIISIVHRDPRAISVAAGMRARPQGAAEICQVFIGGIVAHCSLTVSIWGSVFSSGRSICSVNSKTSAATFPHRADRGLQCKRTVCIVCNYEK
jgi:hypothetical protein